MNTYLTTESSCELPNLPYLWIKIILLAFVFNLDFSIDLLAQQHGPSNKPQLKSRQNSEQYFTFEHISLEQGLSQSTIYDILQDSKGFLWIGTEGGLNRYDGYNFRIYNRAPGDPNSLGNDLSLRLYEDRLGHLWVGTWGGGLNRFDREKDQFIRYQHDSANPHSLSNDNVWAILEDRSGNLWVGTENGLNKFDRDEERFVCYRHAPGNPHSISSSYVESIFEDHSGVLWVATRGSGINKLVPGDNDDSPATFISYRNDPHDPHSLSHDQVFTIFEAPAGVLWIGTNGGGLNKFIPQEEEEGEDPIFVRYQHHPNDPGSLSNNIVRTIHKDQSGSLWIGTNNGLNRLLPDEKSSTALTFIKYSNDPFDPHSLNNNHIMSLYDDQSGNLWIGTYGGGLNKLVPRGKRGFSPAFVHYRKDPENPNSLSHDYVSYIYEDRSGNLWVGTDGGGLNKVVWDRNHKTPAAWIRYLHNPDDPNSLSHDAVYSICQDSHETLWIGTWRGGLNKFNPPNNTFTCYKNDPNDLRSLSNDKVMSILEDSRGALWIGTWGGGLNKIVPAELKSYHPVFIRYRHDPNNSNSLSDDKVYVILEDRSGTLWIGTEYGLNKFDRETEKFTRFYHDPNDPNSLTHNKILSLYEDHTGTLWAGGSWGLNKLVSSGNDHLPAAFIRYYPQEGLPSAVIRAILEDNQGNLWLSTHHGISCFNPQTGVFKNYDVSDGLQSNEFSYAGWKGRDGRMYFGGINGFNAFYPDSIRDNTRVPPIAITDFQIFNASVPIGEMPDGRVILNKAIPETDTIMLSYRDNVFSFQFAALDYSVPGKNQYKYMMQGFDVDWIYAGTRRYVTYTNLDPGEYLFRVKGSNNHGVWNEEGASVKIIITPPFWQTLWFRALVILLVILLAYSWYRIRINKIEAKKKELEERVEERSRAAETLQGALDQVEHLKNQLQAENVYLQDEIRDVHNFGEIITCSNALKKMLNAVEKVAATDATVLILGETGTGKELVARAVHSISNRSDRPLVKVNCATLPENLIESELFGHEKGAFTGALSRKIGRFELANGGTIFLDEIGELPLQLQPKLLRVLQEGEFERLGNSQPIKVDVRVIAATNRNLDEEIGNGHFREDLYYRLNVFPIVIAPLRQRKEDIPLLVKHFAKKFSKKSGRKIEHISQNVIDILQSYHWPGNVRELENVIERAVIISPGKKLVLGDWLSKPEPSSHTSHIPTLEELERKHILEVMELTGWRIRGEKGAANILNMKPTTLASRMEKLGIKRNQ